jgi:hypothetical protein
MLVTFQREAAERLGGAERGVRIAGTGDVGDGAPEKVAGTGDVGDGAPEKGAG